MALLDSIDLNWTRDGDFSLGEDGDVKDTSEDYLLSLENQIRDLVKSSQGDWESDFQFGCDLDDFVGEPNIERTSLAIERRITSKILATQLVPERDLLVKVVPVHQTQVAVFVKVSCNSTPNNRLKFGESIVVSAVYDTMEKGLFFELENNTNKEPF